MPEQVSRSRGEITELTHIAPIKPGLIPGGTITYADRLAAILEAFNRGEQAGFPSVIRVFRGIHFAKWSLIDGDTRLLLSVVFDGDWYDYLRQLALDVPNFLHLIWSNCVGWEPVQDEPEQLFKFIRDYQQKVTFLYAHHPQLTVGDVDWLIAQREAVASIDPPDRARYDDYIDKRVPVVSSDVLRSRLLDAYAEAHQHESKDPILDQMESFAALVGRLYTPAEFEGALLEGFGDHARRLPRAAVQPVPAKAAAQIERDQVQSIVLGGLPDALTARMYWLRFEDGPAARDWLREQTFGFGEGESEGAQIAFSYPGLRVLAQDAALLASLPAAYREGMHARAQRLGDPLQFEQTDVHAVLTVYSKVDGSLESKLSALGEWATYYGKERQAPDIRDELERTLKRHRIEPAKGVKIVGHQDLHRPQVSGPNERYSVEYFGFREGVKNPDLTDAALPKFVLDPSDPLLGNGSFLVVRQLEQHLDQFWQHMKSQAEQGHGNPEQVAELLMGIKRNGDPLLACPFQSHVARVNPNPNQVPNRNPQMIRRSMPYQDARDKRGLMFMAYVADLESQFEFIQRRWIQAGNRAGATSKDRDPIAGLATPSSPPSSFVSSGEAGCLRAELPSFVELRWGGYFFAPSKRGLATLLGDAKPAAPAECPDMLAALERAQGSEAKQALLRRWLDDNDTALRFWTLVERKGGLRVELPSADSKGGQAWSFVADPRLARDILADDGAKFSVCEYARRMRGTTGDFFLGMDPVGPERSNEPSRYDHESRARAIVPTDAASLEATRAAAERASLGYLQTLPLRLQGQEAKRFALVELLAVMLNEVATSAFGVPGPSVASLATWGGDIARYHFRLAADETDAAKVKQSTLDYRAHVERLIGEAGNPVYAGSDTLKRVLAKLEESLGAYATDDAKARNLLGVLTGSLGATIALTSNGLLAYAATHTDGKVEWPRAGRLYDAIIAEPLVKVRRGGPDSLYRKYIGPDDHSYKTQSGQPVPLRHGDLVLAWIGGALPEMGADFLYGDGRHQCPGRAMAKHMIEGVLGVLSQLSVRLFAVGPDVVVELLEIDEIARLTRVEV